MITKLYRKSKLYRLLFSDLVESREIRNRRVLYISAKRKYYEQSAEWWLDRYNDAMIEGKHKNALRAQEWYYYYFNKRLTE